METNTKSINLNDRIEVKLNNIGLKIYEDFYKNLKMEAPKLSENILKIEFWDLANIFGKSFGNGLPIPFESTTLKITD
jgi:hypothetical protein